jgi:hypothetical protein
MTVTASVLHDLVQGPQRVALDAFGNAADRDEINPFVRLFWERGTLFERETIAKPQLPFVDFSKVGEADCERLTFEAMTRGEPLVGRIRAADLLGMPDLLRRETGGYVPAISNPAEARRAATTITTANPNCTTPFSSLSMSTSGTLLGARAILALELVPLPGYANVCRRRCASPSAGCLS